MIDRTPKERLYWLMDLLLNNKIEAQDFCAEFHRTYEFEIEDGDLSAEEKNDFAKIAQKTARFTHFEEDLIQYPNVYISKNTLKNTINELMNKLI